MSHFIDKSKSPLLSRVLDAEAEVSRHRRDFKDVVNPEAGNEMIYFIDMMFSRVYS